MPHPMPHFPLLYTDRPWVLCRPPSRSRFRTLAFVAGLALGGCSRNQTTEPEVDAQRVTQAGSQTSGTATTAASEPPILPVLPDGMHYVGGPELVERIRKTKAKGVVVNVWASWCGPCRVEVPMLQKLHADLGKEQLEFLFVSVDAPDKATAAAEFIEQQRLPRPGYLAKPPLGEFKEAMTPRWRGSLPATFLFDPDGKLRYWWGAQVFEHEIAPVLQGFIAGETIDGEANFKIRQGGAQP